MADEVLSGESFYTALNGESAGASYGDPGFGGHGHYGDLGVTLPKVGFVKMWGADRESIRALLGTGPPLRAHNGTGWEEIPRPRRKPIIEWRAGELDRLTVPILLNGFRNNQSIEPQISILEGWFGSGHSRPPVVQVAFPGNKPTHWKRRWVIENLEYGEMIEWDREGHRRLRQDLVVSLMERGDEDLISPAKNRRRRSVTTTSISTTHSDTFGTGNTRPGRDTGIPGPLFAIHVVKDGDTWMRLAVRYYGRNDEWASIRNANPGLPRDPDRQLPVGERVKIPEI